MQSREHQNPPIQEPYPQRDGLHRVWLVDGRPAWLKQHRARPVSFLDAEARGLALLRDAQGLRVPRVHARLPHALLLEDLGSGSPAPDYPVRAAQGLAAQHAHRSARFGLEHDGWCGDSPQDNAPDADGHRFFVERRLLPQAQRAHRARKLEAHDMQQLQHIGERLAQWIPTQPAALLHGDLWSGNLHCCADGEPALIDAGAVHYGWAEAELAMLTLFGDPGPRFFGAYAEAAPLAADWRERAPLYNLYHLLNHLNLFGSGYLGAVRAVLRRFAGPD